jgi:hypothetical protein
MVEMDSEPNEERPWILARSLATTRAGVVPVRVVNMMEEPVTIKRGSHLGRMQILGTECSIVPPREFVRRVSQQMDVRTDEWENHQKLRQLISRTIADLEPEEKRLVTELLSESRAVFSDDSGALGRTDQVEHEIHTGNSRPIKQPARRIPQHQREAVDELVADMLEKDVIEESSSPWASPIVLVKKKDGTLRFCVDYRQLNAVTEKDAYPLPLIDETLEACAGARWFSTLDLTSGYWQVGMTEDAQKKSAFCIPGGLYQFKVLSFGLCNAPGTFERLMERVLSGLSWKTCLIYLDDIIIYSSTIENHARDIREVFSKLAGAGLKLKPSKCHCSGPRSPF